jgi:hypothetical protein
VPVVCRIFSYHDLLPLPTLFCHGSVFHASIDGAFGRDDRLSTLPPCWIHMIVITVKSSIRRKARWCRVGTWTGGARDSR